MSDNEPEVSVPYTRANMWAELKAKKVEKVSFTFDGSGDSGDINFEEATFKVRSKKKELSDEAISQIENLMYDALEERYGGWEIDDGAYGVITLDVDAMTLTIDISTRVMSTEESTSTVQMTEEEEEEAEQDPGFSEENS